jgi:glycosyltransferase involved in cell wall biosynthesis
MTTLRALPRQTTQLPTASVVVPTYRRDERLRVCLEGVLAQDAIGRVCEVVVVDDARSASVEPVIGALRARHPETPIVLLEGRSAGPAAARNLGWRRARGDIIVFIDDDAKPASPAWLRAGLERFGDRSVDAVSGAVTVPVEGRPTDFQRNVQQLERGVFLTCNAFYRRRALEAVDGFDERFAVPFREDSDLYYRVQSLGGACVMEPRARVIHPAPRGRFGVSLRLQRYSLYNALLYKKHPGRYRADVQAAPPLAYYAMLLLLTGGAIAAMARRRGLAALFLAGWGVLDGRFLLRRLQGTSHTPRDLADMLLTSIAIPPVSIYWRLRGALRFRTWFF